MAQRAKYKRDRKPLIFIVCEGRNKTERTYFGHFNTRKAPFNLHIENSEATDIASMAKKAADIFIENQLDPELGDKVYCLVDLDLEQCKYEKYAKAKKKYKNIEIIPSNPCFEIWLLYYFTEAPKVVHSSQRVKEEMVKRGIRKVWMLWMLQICMTNIGLQSKIRKQKIAGMPRNLIFFQKIRIQRWRPLSRNC